MKRLHFFRNGLMFLPFGEGCGWQFHIEPNMTRRRLRVVWSSYGIDRTERPPSHPGWKNGSNNAYVHRRLFIWEWRWFHLWMDLGIISREEKQPMEAFIAFDWCSPGRISVPGTRRNSNGSGNTPV